MASSSLRSVSKALISLFITALIIASFNLPSIFNRHFQKIKNNMEKKASLILDKTVTIGDIGFLPHSGLILKDIKTQGFEIKRLNIQFNIAELLINKKIKEFHLKGAAVFKKPDLKGPVGYKLNVVITPDVISIGYLTLDFEKFSIGIKGNITNYNTRPEAELNISSKEISILGIAKINNLYSDLKLSRDGLFVKGLDFFLNDLPFGLTCKITDFARPAIELNIVSYPGQLPSLRPFNPMNFELDFSGKKLGPSISGSLKLTTQKLVSVNPRKTYSVTVRLDDVNCIFSNKVISTNVKNIICKIITPRKELYFNASDLKTLAYLNRAKVYLTGLSVSAYKGFAKGNGFLDFNQWPVKSLLDFKVYKLDVTELARAMKLGYELKGSLDFKGVFNNRQDPCLSGRLDIREGYLKNTQVLGMLSDFLKVPSLKDVYFDNISSLASFSSVNKEIVLDKIIVSGQDKDLKGSMRLKTTKKINGNISVRLSTALLKESFKLRLLFFLVGERLKYQDFEFEIGGFVKSPQIKWLSTRFRENVMKHLSGSGQESIEKSLEQAINEITR